MNERSGAELTADRERVNALVDRQSDSIAKFAVALIMLLLVAFLFAMSVAPPQVGGGDQKHAEPRHSAP